ncbi:MAG: hypothetical protein IJP03_05310 [Christensenellaceae bacterium]|nr:hypothetical protein [Christensenellaceae bacterium]
MKRKILALVCIIFWLFADVAKQGSFWLLLDLLGIQLSVPQEPTIWIALAAGCITLIGLVVIILKAWHAGKYKAHKAQLRKDVLSLAFPSAMIIDMLVFLCRKEDNSAFVIVLAIWLLVRLLWEQIELSRSKKEKNNREEDNNEE